MTSRDPRLRIAAAERLARFGPVDHALEVLHDALTRETDLEVRFALVRALGRRGDPRSVPVLIDELQSGSDAEVLLAVDALRSIGGEPGARGLVAALTVSAARQRAIESCTELASTSLGPLVEAVRLDPGNAAALEALASVLSHGVVASEGAVAALTAASAHANPSIRAVAVRALGTTGLASVADVVRARLRDERADVVSAAFDAIGRVGDRSDVATVRDHVTSPSPYFVDALGSYLRLDPEGAHRALVALLPGVDGQRRDEIARVVLASPGTVDTLVLLLDTAPASVISALARRDEPAAFDALLSLAGAPGENARLARAGSAVWLQRHGDGSIPARARAALDSPLLRAVAGDHTVLAELEAALRTEDAEARALAALGLEWLGAGEAELESALSSETDPAARRAECGALESIGASSSAPFLDAALDDPRFLADCGVYIARALPQMSERRRRAYRVALRRALRAPDERLATTAARALAAAEDREALPALLAVLESGSNVRRLAAAHALHALGDDAALASAPRILPTQEARAAFDRVVADGARDVLWVVVEDASARAPYDVDLVGDGGYVRRVRSTAEGMVFVPFPAGGTVDVRVVQSR